MLKILVTGGAGFIGSHLCAALLADGREIVCVDSFITGNRRNIAQLLDHPHFRLIEHDVIEPLDLDVQAIFHLASPASPPGYLKFPLKTALTNSHGTYHLLELALRQIGRAHV